MLINTPVNEKVLDYITNMKKPARIKKPKVKDRRPPSASSTNLVSFQASKAKRKKVTKLTQHEDNVIKHNKRAVFLHRKTLERLFRSPQWAAGEPAIRTAVGKILETISKLKATYEKVKTRRTKKVNTPKSTQRSVVMDLNPRHHKKKVYISPALRAINKAKDGLAKAVKTVLNKSKATLVQAVGLADGIRKKLYGYVKNPTPTPRKQRHAFAKEFKQLFKKEKYSPYSRGKECLLQVA